MNEYFPSGFLAKMYKNVNVISKRDDVTKSEKEKEYAKLLNWIVGGFKLDMAKLWPDLPAINCIIVMQSVKWNRMEEIADWICSSLD